MVVYLSIANLQNSAIATWQVTWAVVLIGAVTL